MATDGSSFPLSGSAGAPHRYALAEQFGVYASYFPPVDMIKVEDLPSDVLDDPGSPRLNMLTPAR